MESDVSSPQFALHAIQHLLPKLFASQAPAAPKNFQRSLVGSFFSAISAAHDVIQGSWIFHS